MPTSPTVPAVRAADETPTLGSSPHDVAVVVPFHNGHRFIREAVESVLAEAAVVHEIVVVDDGSPLGGLDALLADLPSVTVVHQANRGVGAARALGMELTTAPYLCFLDCDDRVAPGALHALRDALVEHPAWGLVSGRARVIDEWGRPTGGLTLPMPEAGREHEALLRKSYICPPGTGLFRRTTFQSVGGWVQRDGRRHVEDYDAFLRVAAAGPIGTVPEIVGEYRQHVGSMSQDKDALLAEILGLLADQAGTTADDPALERARRDGIAHYRREFERLRFEHEIRAAWTRGRKLRACRLLGVAAVKQPRASASRGVDWLRTRARRADRPDGTVGAASGGLASKPPV